MANNLEVGVRLTADSKGLVGESRAAKEAIKGISETAKTANAESAAAAERFTANLKRQADTLGMTASQVRGYDAAQLKLNDAQRASVDASNKAVTAYENQQVALDGLKTRAAAAGIAIGTALVAGLKTSISMAAEAEQSHLRVAAVLRGTGYAAGLTKAELDGMAESMKDKLGIDDDALRDSMAVLLTFRNVSRNSFGEALETAASLSAVMQTDLKSAVLQLGKALENPDEGLTALKRSGVSFNDTQKEMIKGLVETGDQAQAITLILQTMKEQGLDGVAESMNQGITRSTRDFGLAWDDLLKSMGNTDTVKGGVDILFGSLTGYLKDMRQVIESGDWLDRLAFFTIGLKTPDMISKSNTPAILAVDPAAEAQARAGLARQKTAQEAEIAAIAERKRQEEAAKAAEEASKRAISAAKSKAEADKRAAQQAVDSADKTIAAFRRETQEIGLNVIQKRMMAAASEAAKAPTQALAQEIMASAHAWAQATQAQEGNLAMQKSQAQAAEERARAEKDAANQVRQEWHGLWGGVETTAKTAFIQFAAHGKSAMQSIGESIKLSIIDVLYQLTIRKWIVNIGANLSGFAGVGGVGAATATGGGSALNIAGMGLNAASLLKSGFGLPSMMGRGASALGFSAFGAGASGAASAGVFGAGGMPFLAGGVGGAAVGAGATGTAAVAAEFGATAVAGARAAAMLTNPVGWALLAADIAGRLLAGNKTLKGFDMIPVVGGFLAALFGHGPLKFRQQSLQGDISSAGFDGDITNVYRAKGGLLVGNKHKSVSAELSLELQTQLDTTLGGFYTSARSFAQNLGLSVDLVDNFTAQVQIKSEKGKQLTEAAIAQMLDGIGNDIARNALPIVDSLRKAGEDSFDTLSRLNSEFVTLADAATILGKSVAESRAFISGASFEGRTGFVDAAGGADALMQKAQTFATNFLTDAERIAPAQEQLNEQLGKLSLSAGLTKDQFRGLVQSFGQVNGITEETLQSLLNLMPAFLTVTNYTDGLAKSAQELADIERAEVVARAREVNTAQAGLEIELMRLQGKESQALTKARLDELQTIDASLIPLQQAIFRQDDMNKAQEKATAIANATANERTGLETQLLQAQGDTSALRQRELDALDPLNRGLKEHIFALEDEKLLKEKAGKQLDTAFGALQRAVDAERKGVAKHIADIAQSVGKLKDLSGSLRSALSRMQISGSEAADRAAAQAQISAALAIAKASGKLPEAESLRRALDVVAQPSEDLFGSFTDYMRDFARTAADINSLDGLTQNQLGIEDQALKLAESQMSALDGLLTTAQAELDAIRGVDNSIQSLAGALQGFASAKAAVGAAAGGGGSPAAGNIPPLPPLVSAATTPPAPPIGSTGNKPVVSGVTVLGGPGNPKISGRDIVAFLTSGVTPEQGLAKTIETGVSAQQIVSAFAGQQGYTMSNIRNFIESKGLIPGFADGGLHGGGLRIVGERGPELEFTGPSRIVSNPESRKLLDLAEVVAELKALRAEMAAIKANTGSTATNTQKTSDLLDDVSAGGGPLLVTQVS